LSEKRLGERRLVERYGERVLFLSLNNITSHHSSLTHSSPPHSSSHTPHLLPSLYPPRILEELLGLSENVGIGIKLHSSTPPLTPLLLTTKLTMLTFFHDA
jgi:hypothetical protein